MKTTFGGVPFRFSCETFIYFSDVGAVLVSLAWSGSSFEHSSGVTLGAGGIKRRFLAGSGAAFTNGVRTGDSFSGSGVAL